MCSAWRLASVCHVIVTGLMVSRNVHGVKMFFPQFLYQSLQEEGNNLQTKQMDQRDNQFFSANS